MKQFDLKKVILRHRSLPILAVLVVIFAIWAPGFASSENLGNVVLQVSFDGVMVVGMAIALIGGQFDLSIGSTMVMASFVAVTLAPVGLLPALVASVLFGCAVGLVNGLLVTAAKVNAFIATLGTMFAVRGLMLAYSGGFPKTAAGVPGFTSLAEGKLGPIPIPILIFAALVVASHVLLAYTRPGRRLYALGGNAEFARLAGEPVRLYQALLFIGTGATAGLGGVMLASRLGAASPILGNDTALIVISAVILGGISLYGGIGSIPLAIEGIFTIGVLDNGMNLIGVPPYYQFVVRGSILIMVVVLDAYLMGGRRRSARLISLFR